MKRSSIDPILIRAGIRMLQGSEEARRENRPLLPKAHIQAFAEDLFDEYGPMADLQALKRADALAARGDKRNSLLWYEILDRVREMQNRSRAGRVA